jgi:large subunit ribosomal protein L35
MTSLLLRRAWHDARTRIVAAVSVAPPRSTILLPSLSSCPAAPAASPTTLCVRWKHGAKSHQGAKKRFRLLKNGDVLRGHAGKSHNTGHRSTVQMSRLRVSTTIAPSFAARIRRLVLGV